MELLFLVDHVYVRSPRWLVPRRYFDHLEEEFSYVPLLFTLGQADSQESFTGLQGKGYCQACMLCLCRNRASVAPECCCEMEQKWHHDGRSGHDVCFAPHILNFLRLTQHLSGLRLCCLSCFRTMVHLLSLRYNYIEHRVTTEKSRWCRHWCQLFLSLVKLMERLTSCGGVFGNRVR